MLTSQGLVFATALAVSAGTILLFDLFREKYVPDPENQTEKQALKSCLSSGCKKREKEKKRKKRVKFADDVKDSKGNGELYRREHCRKCAEIRKNCCGNEFEKMPANRAVLYSGILKDRVQRMEYSY